MEEKLYNGVVKFFNLKSRFGFINEENTKNEYYFYIKNPAIKFTAGEKVCFNLKEGKKGMEAINISSNKS
jgi:CspA family cold shock protein